MASAVSLHWDATRQARRARARSFERFIVLGDDTLAPRAPECGPGPAELLAERVGARALNLAEEGATSADVVAEQLPLALALEPTFALVCVGTREAALHLDAAGSGDASFLNALLADLHAIVAKLRAAGADVLIARPPSLAATPAAWLRFGSCYRPSDGRRPREFPEALRRLGRVGTRWSRACETLAFATGARFVDLTQILDAALERGLSERDLDFGLPPYSGGPHDLFSDALHLSALGAGLGADLLAEAVGPPYRGRSAAPERTEPAPRALPLEARRPERQETDAFEFARGPAGLRGGCAARQVAVQR